MYERRAAGVGACFREASVEECFIVHNPAAKSTQRNLRNIFHVHAR